MSFIIQLVLKSSLQVWATFLHNWPFLFVSVVIAVCLKLFINADKVSAFLVRYRKAGVVGATAAAVATPLCSCGTTAIILGMMASTMPWAPIIAFMVASPLTSPEELIYSAGLFGWPFATAFFVSSIILGLLGGLIGEILDRRGWLANQSRFSAPANRSVTEPACACDSAPATRFSARPSLIKTSRPHLVASALNVSSSPAREAALNLSASCACSGSSLEPASSTCACDQDKAASTQPAVTWKIFLAEAFSTGKRLLIMFLGFAFIGYFLNGLIPSAWVSAVFGPGNIYSVPLAATLGLPLYINSEASLPLVRALIEGGMSQGAAMAFLITGAGTSIGAIAGAFTIARWRVIVTVIGTLWLGAIATGFLYDFFRVAGLF